uniref:CBS domain-containing protein n=1 Tax=candidate division WOR-3 bacterium TaxID=2052148 RepID=A0A7C4UFU0_UNCW3
MKVKEIMIGEPIRVAREDTIEKAINIFKTSPDVDVLPVVDENDNLIGALRRRDLIWPFLSFIEESGISSLDIIEDYPSIYLVDDVMEWEYPSVESEENVINAIAIMESEGIDTLLVVSDGKLVGLLTNDIILNLIFKNI